jgi:hypothetical protein
MMTSANGDKLQLVAPDKDVLALVSRLMDQNAAVLAINADLLGRLMAQPILVTHAAGGGIASKGTGQ